jgi:hypothetical protein
VRPLPRQYKHGEVLVTKELASVVDKKTVERIFLNELKIHMIRFKQTSLQRSFSEH